MADPNPWMRCAQRLSELGLAGAAGPSADLLVDALRVLLWLCSERAPVPHSVGVGPGRSVVFSWRQGGAAVEVEAVAPGRAVWRATGGGEEVFHSSRLDARAAHALRSLIPLTRESHRPAPPPPPPDPHYRPDGRAPRPGRPRKSPRD